MKESQWLWWGLVPTCRFFASRRHRQLGSSIQYLQQTIIIFNTAYLVYISDVSIFCFNGTSTTRILYTIYLQQTIIIFNTAYLYATVINKYEYTYLHANTKIACWKIDLYILYSQSKIIRIGHPDYALIWKSIISLEPPDLYKSPPYRGSTGAT